MPKYENHPKYNEDFCYVGDCCVCDEPVDESKAGYCGECGQPFCWSNCGGWGSREHVCNNCKTEDEDEDDE